MPNRTRCALAVTLCLTVTPLAAQNADPSDQGRSLIEEGAKLFLRGLMQEMEPALETLEDFAQEIEPAMRDFAQNMGPALRDLLSEVEDWSVYHPPERLPNGDIIIRRKTPLPEKPDMPGSDQPEIEL